MRRIDIIFDKLQELCNGKGITTIEIASSLNLSRANVSSDLNKLCEEGKVVKKYGKPVLYLIKDEYKKTECSNDEELEPSIKKGKIQEKYLNTLDDFALKNESLYSTIEQAKAGILYPPRGMNMLILGETGVGKSMFVNLIYKYAVEMKRFKCGSPFITFNCADYANNPQLLLGQLFGSNKGAYTGADTDKIGLIEKANNGILFLDEVHRLPPEGQEMLFTFMDKGLYRRLGETEFERSAKVLIISATTEEPNTSLLKTFTRRIPMILNIPALKNRTMNERFELVSTFMKEESSRLEKNIKVSINSIKALLSYDCPNNIGQLKADIQLICAKVYADFILGKKNEIKINTLDLPQYIRQGLYMEVEHRQLWNRLIDINRKYCVFDNSRDEVIFEDYKNEMNIYELVDYRYSELKSRGLDDNKLLDAMKIDIDNYFKKYMHKFDSSLGNSNLETLIDKEIIRVIEEVIRFSQERLNIHLSKKVYFGMVMHINVAINRIRSNQKISNPRLNKIRTEHPIEFNVALDCLKIIERALDISMPIEEAGFLTMFFAYDIGTVKYESKKVKVIVIAHGKSTATSMVEAVNELLETEYAIGINAPINEKSEMVLESLKSFIRENNVKDDIFLLVDMGSLTTFNKEIEKEFNIKTKAIPLVSTLHVVEATRKAMMGYSLNEIFNDTLKVNDVYRIEVEEIVQATMDYSNNKKLAILSICTTGEGGAKEIKNLLEESIYYDKNFFEIINISAIDDEIFNKIKEEFNVLAIVSTFTFEEDIPQFNLEDIFIGEGLNMLQKIIDVEDAYIKMSDTIKEHLKNIDGVKALKDIKRFNSNIQSKLNIKLPTNRLIGIILHIACMLERLKDEIVIDEFKNKEQFIEENKDLYNLVRNETLVLNTEYGVEIVDDEVCYIATLFDKK